MTQPVAFLHTLQGSKWAGPAPQKTGWLALAIISTVVFTFRKRTVGPSKPAKNHGFLTAVNSKNLQSTPTLIIKFGVAGEGAEWGFCHLPLWPFRLSVSNLKKWQFIGASTVVLTVDNSTVELSVTEVFVLAGLPLKKWRDSVVTSYTHKTPLKGVFECRDCSYPSKAAFGGGHCLEILALTIPDIFQTCAGDWIALDRDRPFQNSDQLSGREIFSRDGRRTGAGRKFTVMDTVTGAGSPKYIQSMFLSRLRARAMSLTVLRFTMTGPT